jgi:hypothetical protein
MKMIAWGKDYFKSGWNSFGIINGVNHQTLLLFLLLSLLGFSLLSFHPLCIWIQKYSEYFVYSEL